MSFLAFTPKYSRMLLLLCLMSIYNDVFLLYLIYRNPFDFLKTILTLKSATLLNSVISNHLSLDVLQFFMNLHKNQFTGFFLNLYWLARASTTRSNRHDQI